MDNKKQSSFSFGIFEKLAVIFLIVVASTTFVLCLYTWRNTQMVLDARSDILKRAPFNPPPIKELAKTARYIVHYVDWTVIASFLADGSGYPLASEESVSDGPVTDSTGVPYIYIASFSPLSKSIEKNPKVSFIFTEVQTEYCSKMDYDPEDPRCAKIILSGELIKVPANETSFAKEALFSRHPQMSKWPKWHRLKDYRIVMRAGWRYPAHKITRDCGKAFFAFEWDPKVQDNVILHKKPFDFSLMKLVVDDVKVLDYFGGRKDVSVKDYFNAKINI